MLSLRLLMVAVVAGCSTGCALYSSRPVEVVVSDIKTGEPVPDLSVSVYYMATFVLNIPNDEHAVTDANGRAVLPMADFANGLIHLRAGDCGRSLSVDDVRQGGKYPLARWTTDPEAAEVAIQLTPRPRSLRWWLLGSE